MATAKHPHEVLGVPPQASARQVRKAYKRLAAKYHPDRNPDPAATDMFKAVKAAHDAMLSQIEAGGYQVAVESRRPAPPPARPKPKPPPPPRAKRRGPPPPRRPPPRRPSPKGPDPQREAPSGSPWVIFEEDPVAAQREPAKSDHRERERRPPPPPPEPLGPTYRFEWSDITRPALYFLGFGSWFAVLYMIWWAYKIMLPSDVIVDQLDSGIVQGEG